MFSFLAAGITISAACLFLNKNCSKTKTLYMTIPAILCTRPFQIHNGGKAAEFFIPTAIAFLFYFSVRKKQQSTTRREVLEGLPSELISVGIIYMILSVY